MLIAVEPTDDNGAGTGTTEFTRIYTSGTRVTLSAPYVSGENNFFRWLQNGSQVSTNNIVTFNIIGNETYTAEYQVSVLDSSQSVGLEDRSMNLKNLKIYPNPTSDLTTIDFELITPSILTLKLTNTLGSLIKTIVLDPLSIGKHKKEIDLSTFSNGICLISLESLDKSVWGVRRIVINK